MSKKITITNAKQCTETGENKDLRLCMFEIDGGEEMQVSDGYHTMDELYEHRHHLYISFVFALLEMSKFEKTIGVGPYIPKIWKSLVHHDGSRYDGWFILGINEEKGEQISYHLPIKYWETTDRIETLERAPEWDGHTSLDVLERLRAF